MFTLASPCKKVKAARLSREVAGRSLVLVFPAMRRHLALRAAWVFLFSKFELVKKLYTV